METITVTKASGDRELFNEDKLRHSLANAGAGQQIIEQITRTVEDVMYDGIPTKKIYKEAFRMLRQHSNRSAGRYKLKKAILELGPTGYPFEKFVGELLGRLGYNTQTGVTVEGDCVSHEIDVIAEKDDEHFMIECKFHNRKRHKCNVRIPLYIQSRFKDVEKNWSSQLGHENKRHRGWVVTNTRFTKDARDYGECVGLKLLSWDYPEQSGLKDLIDRVSLHPITSLSTLSKKDKKQLLEKDIVFCLQLCKDEQILSSIGMDNHKKNRVLKEAQDICNTNTNE